MLFAGSSEGTSSESAAIFLDEASQMLAASFDLSVTLPRVARFAASHLADCCIIEVQSEEGRPRVHAVACRVPGIADAIRLPQPSDEDEEQAAAPILELLPPSWWDQGQLRPLAVETIYASGNRVGALALANMLLASPAVPEGEEAARDLARELKSRLGTAIDNAQRYMRERRVARSFQTALLPAVFPAVRGHAFHASYAPATDEAEVGGDWYDAFGLPDGRIAMSIGDVAGHGLEAAVVMGEVRQTFRVAAMENRDPGAVLDMANRLLLLRSQSTMVTAIFGTYDGSRFTYASAGHPPPILGTLDGRTERLPIAGIPLGVDAGAGRTSWTVTMPPGSLLVLYTDGLIECDHNVLDGEKALVDAVRAEVANLSNDPARAIRDRILGTRRNLDDVAVLTFSVEEAPMQQLDIQYTAAPVAARLVRQSVTRFACDSGLNEEQSYALNVAIGEAVNNVIEHAYLRSPGTFWVRVRYDAGKVTCVVEDSGVWRRARHEGRGHGLSIIRSLMDGVEVNLSQEGTLVKMVLETDGGSEKKRDESAAR